MDIRSATLKDIDLIKEYRTKVSTQTEYMNNPSKEKIKETLEIYINDKNKFYFIVIKDEEIIGLYCYYINKEKSTLHIDHISVIQLMYGTGLSKQLMEIMEKEGKKEHIEILELIVHRDNIRGIMFYEKLGYKLVREAKHILTYRKMLNIHKRHSLENW